MPELQRKKLGTATPIRRLLTGLWQMADQEGDGETYDLDAAADAFPDYPRAGIGAFDMADHYGSTEIVHRRQFAPTNTGAKNPTNCLPCIPSKRTFEC